MGDTPLPKQKGTPQKPKDFPATDSRSKKVLHTLFPTDIVVDHDADGDTLLDVKIGNPLRKITQLLEDIKKQKAFSFTLKGSLGVAGIALIVTTFGIFGGTKAFCSKGTQSHIGTLQVLNMIDQPDRSIIVERMIVIWDALTGNDFTRKPRQRMVLIKNDESVLTIKERVEGLSITSFKGPVIATGDLDACSNTLTIKDINGIQNR
jgi:hypothetical protein